MTSAVTRLVTPIVTSRSLIEPSAATTRTLPCRGAGMRAPAAPGDQRNNGNNNFNQFNNNNFNRGGFPGGGNFPGGGFPR